MRRKVSEKKIARIAGLILLLVVINLLALFVHYRLDLTEEKRYSLTHTTKELLRQLEEPVSITVFLKGDYPSEFKKLSNATDDFLRTLKNANSSKVRYRFIDPNDEIANGKTWTDSLSSLGATPINVNVQKKSGEENKFVYPYALLNYNDTVSLIHLFESSKRNISASESNNAESMMEYQFAKTIDKLLHPQKPSVAYAIGNDEPQDARTFSLWYSIDPESVPRENVNPQYFDLNARSNYKLGLFNIETQPSIPNEIDVLILVKPAKAFSDMEKLKLDQYIMRGGKVIWFIDNLHAEQDSLNFKPQLIAYERNLGLQDLLFHYGVRINPDLIMDLQCDFMPFVVGGSNSDPQYEFLHWNYYPLFESHGTHQINKNLGLVASRFVNSVDTVEANGIKKTFLLQSSSNSRTISTPALISPNENRNVPEDALFKQHNIPAAVLLEGKFTSFFKNRLAKTKKDSLQQYGGYKEESAIENKMIVVSDGDIVLNDVSTKEGPIPMGKNLFTLKTQYEYPFANRDFLLNCLEYLTNNSGIVETRNKVIVLRLLNTRKVEEQRTTWQLINIALPVLIIILFGIIYQQIRRRKYAS
jgi:gliding-associated putative ABC transporter substrate-binding component GldG